MNLTNEELSWMAGIIDGEGTLTITRQIRKGRPSPAFRPILQVTNTDIRLVQPFYEAFGGGIYERPDNRQDSRGVNWAKAWTWHCPDSILKCALEAIRPFLHGCKKDVAGVILEFIAHKKSFPRYKGSTEGSTRGGSKPLGKTEIEFRESLWLAVKGMNPKGQEARSQL